MSEIRVDTITEKTSANGVAIDSVTLKDGGVTGTAAIVAGGGNGPTLGFQLKDTSGNAQPRLTNDANNDTVIRPGASGRQIMLANYANNATALNVDDSGHVTKPLQPCFHAELGSTTQSNFSTGSTTLQYKIERFDQNADFNTSNYTFTAPVQGRYLICANVELSNIDNANDYMRMRMNTSNLDYYQGIMAPNLVFSADGGYFSMHMAQIVDMDANDTCLIQVQINSGTAQTDIVGTTANVFSGCLLA